MSTLFRKRFVLLVSVATLVCSNVAAQCARFVGSGTSEGDFLGASVAGHGFLGVAGAPWQNVGNAEAGAVYLFDIPTGTELATLVGPNGIYGDLFGSAVAVTAEWILVGASGEDNANGTNAGAAYLFDRTTVNLVHRLLAPDGASDDRFGTSVSISGTAIIVGAPSADAAGTDSGQVYIFDAASGGCTGSLTSSGAKSFGTDVASSRINLVIGAWDAAHVFELPSLQEMYVLPSPQPGAFFGSSVDVEGGNLLVGAMWEDGKRGAAYVFERSSGALKMRLAASDGKAKDNFGVDVAMFGDSAVIGTYVCNSVAPWAGSAYVYDVASGVERQKLEPCNPEMNNCFGRAVGASGTFVLVGDLEDDEAGQRAGAVYVFDDPHSIGQRYCSPANPHSGGVSAVSSAIGSDYALCHLTNLRADSLPLNKFGYFLGSLTKDYVPFAGGSQGNLCLGGMIGRFTQEILNSGADGSFSIEVDLKDMPPPLQAVQPGETWNFQAWFRDKNPGPTSNFTDGLSITFR